MTISNSYVSHNQRDPEGNSSARPPATLTEVVFLLVMRWVYTLPCAF